MPEYYLPGKGSEDFAALPPLVRGYIEAAFFTSEDTEGRDESAVPEGYGFDDLAPEALEDIVKDCQKFENQYSATLAALVGLPYAGGTYDMEAAGRDFWYTRNGHGVGFWDRGFEDDAATAAEVLTQALSWKREYGESYLYKGDDGKVYHT